MGSCNYYLKATFAEPLTEEKAKVIRDFLVELSKAESWWQGNRGTEPNEFWPEFTKQFPNATRYLQSQGINTETGDSNNLLAGKLEAGWEDYVEDAVKGIQKGLTVVKYTAEVWHLCSWDPLAAWFRTEYNAKKVDWVSEEYLEDSDPFDSLGGEETPAFDDGIELNNHRKIEF